MTENYRDRIRAAIVDIARDIAALQKQLTNAANDYESAKEQGDLAKSRAQLATRRSQVLIAKASLEQRVEHLKELAAQIPADSDDCGLFDTLAVALEAVESAERFIETGVDATDV